MTPLAGAACIHMSSKFDRNHCRIFSEGGSESAAIIRGSTSPSSGGGGGAPPELTGGGSAMVAMISSTAPTHPRAVCFARDERRVGQDFFYRLY